MIPLISTGATGRTAPQHVPVSALGMTFDCTDVVETAELIAARPARRRTSARLYVTPNIQHVAEMRKNPELRAAVREADLVTADGFPIVRYAQLAGCPIPGRITGREVVEELMLNTRISSEHVLYFLLDSDETARAVRSWAERRNLAERVFVDVAPPRFGQDRAACAALANRVREVGTTILFLGLGAPKCELFAYRYRAQLGGCWALCIGQSVRVALGLVKHPPSLCVKLHMEWAWRIALEPRRLVKRYVSSSVGFGAAIVEDLMAQARRRA